MIRRQLRVDLQKFDASWSESFIMVGTQNPDGLMKFQSSQRKLERDKRKIDRDLDAIQNKIESLEQSGTPDAEKEIDALYVQHDALQDEIDKNSAAILKTLGTAVKGAFVCGKIYDFDEKTTRDMTKEDIDSFDIEVLTHVSGQLFGNVEKKAY